MTPHLPTELTDLIIDHLAHNLHDDLLIPHKIYRPYILAPLTACSLVSSAFHNRISYHIFSTITLSASALSSGNRKQTVSGLLDILNDGTFGRRVHTLKLFTAPTYFPAKFAWGEVDEDFPTILKDPFLPHVLHKLTGTYSLHLIHRYPDPFRYSDLSEDMKRGIEAILGGQYLSRLEVVGFSELPRSLLVHCRHLIQLDYHELDAQVPKISVPTQSSIESCHSLPFTLQYASLTGCNDFVEALIADGAFSNLKTFKHNLHVISDIYTSSRIIHQASSTLEIAHISHLDSNRFMEEIKDSPIDFGSLLSIRKITVSSFGYFQRPDGTQLQHSHALCKLLSNRESAFLSSSGINSSSIEFVRLAICWGGTTAKKFLERYDPGWDELDKILGNSPLFRRLRVVEIHVKIDSIDMYTPQRFDDGSYSVDVLKKEILQRMNHLFKRLRASKAIKLSILINQSTIIV